MYQVCKIRFPSNTSQTFSSGDIQNPPGQGPVHPAVGDPALAGGLNQMIHRGPFQPLTFCDSSISLLL